MMTHATQYTNRLHAANACPPKQVHPGLSKGTELKRKVLHIPSFHRPARLHKLHAEQMCASPSPRPHMAFRWRPQLQTPTATSTSAWPPAAPASALLWASESGSMLQASDGCVTCCWGLAGHAQRATQSAANGRRASSPLAATHHPRSAPGLTYTWGPAHGASGAAARRRHARTRSRRRGFACERPPRSPP